MIHEKNYINFGIIVKALGALIAMVGAFMLIPALVALFSKESDFAPLFGSALFSICVGLLLRYSSGREKFAEAPKLHKREGYIIVTFSWIAMSIFGAIPFIIDRNISTFTDAFFETISGLTTTGVSVVHDIEALPKGLMLWRCMTQWIGGIGIVVFSLAILPLLGISGGNNLFFAEMTGPTKDKIRPKIASTAKTLVITYVILTFLQTIFLLFGEMNLFDAVCHSFTTIATGGFSTKNTSLMEYGAYTHYVVLAFMLLSGINFSLYFFAITGKFNKILKNSELKSYLGFLFLAVIFLAVMLYTSHVETSSEETVRDAAFAVVSFVTTTGFVNADYQMWTSSTNLFLLALLFTGACSGSSTGGIKMGRHALLIKNTLVEFKRQVHPRAVIPVRYNGEAVSSEIIFRVLAFFFLYMLIIVLAAVAFSIMGYNVESAFGISASALGNTGVGMGEIHSVGDYADMPIFGKWLMCLLMVIGRLELFTVLILFTPAFWRK